MRTTEILQDTQNERQRTWPLHILGLRLLFSSWWGRLFQSEWIASSLALHEVSSKHEGWERREGRWWWLCCHQKVEETSQEKEADICSFRIQSHFHANNRQKSQWAEWHLAGAAEVWGRDAIPKAICWTCQASGRQCQPGCLRGSRQLLAGLLVHISFPFPNSWVVRPTATHIPACAWGGSTSAMEYKYHLLANALARAREGYWSFKIVGKNLEDAVDCTGESELLWLLQ